MTGSVGVRRHVGAHDRMLSTYLNAVLHAGLEFESFMAAADLPRMLIIQGRRPREATHLQ